MTAGAPAGGERGTGYRPDIDGLRAVAVLLIILYHAGVTALPGGYVGVDVFFVISGFLITGLLVKEIDETGTLSLRSFYARRARRILPASFLVLAATLVGCALFFSPVGLWRAAREIAIAAVYVPNLLFAYQVTDYFHPARVSAVIHYWSLGVEEQFYVVYPAFLLLAHRFARRRGPRIAGWVAIAVVASAALSVAVTAINPTASFYLLPTRAWELGAGALLALAGPRLTKLGSAPAIASGAAALGLVLIGASALLFTSATRFPGVAAFAPVLGTVLVIGAGGTGGATQTAWLSRALALPPMRYVGRISYSLYLWHWPLLVFAGIALQHVVPAGVDAVIAVALTFVLAHATYSWVEDPLRHGKLIGRRPDRNLATALLASIVLVAVSLGGGKLAVARFERPAAALTGTTAGDPLAGVLTATGPTQDEALPANAIPSLLAMNAGGGGANPIDDGCSLVNDEIVNGPCIYGDPSSPNEVVLFGDSHATQWWPALETIMTERDWKVVVLVKTSCTYADVTAVSVSGPKVLCDAWRKTALARIQAEHPAMVIVSSNHRAPPLVDGIVLQGAAATAAMADGVARTIAILQSTGAKVVVIGDTPQVPTDPADCLSANANHVLRCANPRATALDPTWVAAEQAAAQGLGATFVDTGAWVCPSDPCPEVIGRFVVYADTNHLTKPFVNALTTRLDAAIPR